MDTKRFLLVAFAILLFAVVAVAFTQSGVVYTDFRHAAVTIGDGKNSSLNGTILGNGRLADVTCVQNCTGFTGWNITANQGVNTTDSPTFLNVTANVSGQNVTANIIGGIVYSDKYADGSVTGGIQEAINNLTTGRSYGQKVVSNGDYNINSTIILKNYTILEINGRLVAATNMNVDMIQALADTHDFSVVLNGELNGNKANNPTSMIGINVYNSQLFTISGTGRVLSFKGSGVVLNIATQCTVSVDTAGNSEAGIRLQDVSNCQFPRIFSQDNLQDGLKLMNSSARGGTHDNTFGQLFLKGNSWHGLTFAGLPSAWPSYKNYFANLISRDNSQTGVVCDNCYENSFVGGLVDGNSVAGAGLYPGFLFQDGGNASYPAHNNTIMGIHILNSTNGKQKYPVQSLENSTRLMMIGNNIGENVSVVGTNCIINNPGLSWNTTTGCQ